MQVREDRHMVGDARTRILIQRDVLVLRTALEWKCQLRTRHISCILANLACQTLRFETVEFVSLGCNRFLAVETANHFFVEWVLGAESKHLISKFVPAILIFR